MDNGYEEYLKDREKFLKENSIYGYYGKPVKDKNFLENLSMTYIKNKDRYITPNDEFNDISGGICVDGVTLFILDKKDKCMHESIYRFISYLISCLPFDPVNVSPNEESINKIKDVKSAVLLANLDDCIDIKEERLNIFTQMSLWCKNNRMACIGVISRENMHDIFAYASTTIYQVNSLAFFPFYKIFTIIKNESEQVPKSFFVIEDGYGSYSVR